MTRSDGNSYDGIAYADLRFNTISWSPEVMEHMATRSTRYGRPDFDITDHVWAAEAVADPLRLVGDGRSNDGQTVRVIGYSPSAPGRDGGRGRLMKVWLTGDGEAADGRWIGRTACEANNSDRRAYSAEDDDYTSKPDLPAKEES